MLTHEGSQALCVIKERPGQVGPSSGRQLGPDGPAGRDDLGAGFEDASGAGECGLGETDGAQLCAGSLVKDLAE
jgi:hypothetical protein